ncbi:MAG TPA: hypothetical protein VF771_18810 [Longimicrobiaceae bacterium]
MKEKLKLEEIAVESYATGEAAPERGTVHARSWDYTSLCTRPETCPWTCWARETCDVCY